MTPTEPGQFTGEAVVVLHHLVGAEAVPPDEGIVEKFGVIAPMFIFEKFLAHEQHRNAGAGENKARGDAGATAIIPRVRIARVGQPGDTDAVVANVDLVVALDVFDSAPRGSKAAPIKRAGHGIEAEVGTGAGGSLG